MKRLNLLVVCLLINSTVSFCQQSNDSIKCYNRSVLVKIATKLAKGQECDTLLSISEKELVLKSEIIRNDSLQIQEYKTIVDLKEGIITGKDSEIKTINLKLKATQKKLLWGSILFGSTTITLITFQIHNLLFSK